MAGGDGFNTKPMGFDKNEVNAYISDMRKKMSALEAAMKENDAKTKAAEKLAEEADSRIKEAAAAGEKKAEEANKQLAAERQNTLALRKEIDSLKAQLENEKNTRQERADAAVAEAKRSSGDIIEKAKAEAAGIVDQARSKAQAIIDGAGKERDAALKSADSFLALLDKNMNSIISSYKSISGARSSLASGAPVEADVPEDTDSGLGGLAAAAAAVAFAPVPDPNIVDDGQSNDRIGGVQLDEGDDGSEGVSVIQSLNIAAAALSASAQPAEEDSDMPELVVPDVLNGVSQPSTASGSDDDIPSMPGIEDAVGGGDVFNDMWGGPSGSGSVQNIFSAQEQGASSVPLVNPNARTSLEDDIFGLGNLSSSDDDMTDMSGLFDQPSDDSSEELVSEVKPLDAVKGMEISFDNDFANDLLAQTMPSGSLGGDVDDSTRKAVQQAQNSFAVKPADVDMADISMDEAAEPASSAEAEEDDLMKALREAEAALNSIAGSSGMSFEAEESAAPAPAEEEPAADANDPWADLQKQLEAMEQSGGLSAEPAAADAPAEEEQPAVPSADDASIWSFGSDSGGESDDNMSSDMFGDFGGF